MATIWIIEDDATLLFLLSDVLQAEGREFVLLNNGEKAIERMQKKGEPLPDLILMDVMMPFADGVVLRQRLKEEDRFRDIPIIVMTARGKFRDVFQKELAVADFFEKPFDLKRLRAAIDKALRKSKNRS